MHFGLIHLTIRLTYDYCSRLYGLGSVFLLLQQYPYFIVWDIRVFGQVNIGNFDSGDVSFIGTAQAVITRLCR